jgi:hypothetical protein
MKQSSPLPLNLMIVTHIVVLLALYKVPHSVYREIIYPLK